MARRVEARSWSEGLRARGVWRSHLEKMAEELELHMQKEEQILFPLIRATAAVAAWPSYPCRPWNTEHRDHGENLVRLRELAHDFAPPEEACGTWRALYLGLAELESELMQHIHLENNVLFPSRPSTARPLPRCRAPQRAPPNEQQETLDWP